MEVSFQSAVVLYFTMIGTAFNIWHVRCPGLPTSDFVFKRLKGTFCLFMAMQSDFLLHSWLMRKLDFTSKQNFPFKAADFIL